MRPLSLTIEGLRSYRSRTEIDFEGVGLFAITGQTGAGKSSLLEALVFALYHASTFDKTRVKALITDGLDDMTVSLKFRVGGQDWQVTRSISNLASRPAIHELRRPDGVLVEKKKEVDETIQNLLGLSCDDFLKTVVLPQGKFQALLHSKPSDRAPLLKSLLGLDELDLIAEAVAAWRESLKASLNQVRGLRSGLSVSPEQQAELAQKLSRLEAQRDRLKAQVETARALLLASQNADQRQTLWLREKAQLEECQLPPQSRLESLSEQETEYALEQTQLENRLQKMDELTEKLEKTRAARATAGLDGKGLQKAWDQLTRLESHHPRQAELKQELETLEKSLERESEELKRLEKARAEDGQQLAQLESAGVEIRQKLEQATQQLESARGLLVQREQWLRELRKEDDNQARLAAEIETHEGQTKSLQDLLSHSLEALESARSQVVKAETEERVAALCHDLDEGSPCPVCQQSFPEGWEPPLGDTLRSAQELFQTQEREWRTRQRDLDRLQAQGESLNQALTRSQKQGLELVQCLSQVDERLKQEFESSPQELLQLLEKAREQLVNQRQELAARYESRRTQLRAHEEALTAAQKRHQQNSLELERKKESQNRLEREQRQLTEQLTQLLQSQELETQRCRLQEHSQALEELHREESEIAAHKNQLLQSLSELGRSRTEEVQQPLRQVENQMRRLEARLVDAPTLLLDSEKPLAVQLLTFLGQLELARTRRLGELDHQLEQGRASRDQAAQALQEALSEMEVEEFGEAEKLLEELSRDTIVTEQNLTQLREQAEKARQLDELLGPAEKKDRALDFLHGTLGNRRIKGSQAFSQWMLARRQRELLEIASRAFGEMTAGHYGFSPDFEVVDRNSGQARRPNTLSGGESFMASLALALALSELVGRRGGRLEAFFLDEGFGSLSPECLDRALDALEALAQSGRMIGLISHVAGVAERIETVWRVVKTPNGSQVETVAPEQPLDLAEIQAALVPRPAAPPPPEPVQTELEFDFDPEQHPLFA